MRQLLAALIAIAVIAVAGGAMSLTSSGLTFADAKAQSR